MNEGAAEEGYGNHPSQRVDPRTGKKYVPPKSPLGQGVAEGWSQKYKSSINCSHPKGFSQKAHCAGKKKHDESIETEMTCPDCGMCEAHGNSKIYNKCWTGFRKVPGKGRGEDGSCKKISEGDDPWGDQGNFAGDKPVNIGGSFTRPKLEVGSLVRVNAGHLKGIGEIEEIKGDQAKVWINSYARSFVVDLKDLVPYTKNEGVAGAVVGGAAGAYIGKNARSAMAGADLGSKIQDKFTTEKIKGADGKACWDGYRYNGTENGKDKCVEISEDVQNIMDALINKIIVNEAIQNKNR
jgi:hypothetical protein